MKKASEPRPADFVRAAMPDERLWQLWDGIERGEAHARARRRRLRQSASGAALLGVLVLALTFMRSAPGPAAGASIDPDTSASNGQAARHLSLADGSVLALADGSNARVVTMTTLEVRVRLDQGSVECEVPPVPGRRFVVEAAGFEVVVKGTHFSVSLAGEGDSTHGVSVGVERGLVEIREAPDRVLALLGPGQRWSSERNGAAPPAAPTEGLPRAASPVVPPVATAASASASAPTRAPGPAPTLPPRAAPPGPRALFKRGNTARLRGNTRDAEAAFDELRRRYPTDARAGYAAFMLGRLRLDALADPNGAVDAFSFAVAHPGSGFFLEDAEARLIEALAQAGRGDDCRSARDRFLASHPQAARARVVAQWCDE
jgi:FecR-like protein